MHDRSRLVLSVQLLLTISALEFFGPIARDFNATHAWNPTWVGHARFHLVWLLGFMGLSGVVNLHLIWRRRELWLSSAWQCCNLGGFWVAYVLVPVYAGLVVVPGEHTKILGVDENVFVFTILSTVLASAIGLLAFGAGRDTGHARD